MGDTNSDTPGLSKADNRNRQAIAMIVLISSILGLLVLAGIIIFFDHTTAKDIFNALLPVFATWVGTLLAFYFSKDNFEAATRSVTNMADRISAADEKLKQILVRDKMRLLKDMEVYPIKIGDESKCVLSKLLDDKKYERIPMLDADSKIVYLVYKATLHQFLSRLALGKIPGVNVTPAAATLADAFAADPTLKETFQKSYGFVSQTATLADAQKEMDRISGHCSCNDIFVTASGRPNEAIIGWVTDNTISENLKV